MRLCGGTRLWPLSITSLKILQTSGVASTCFTIAGIPELYFGGDMEAAIPLSGQVVGRIDAVKSADEIVQETMTGFYDAVELMASTYSA